jgi:hypothetical protein
MKSSMRFLCACSLAVAAALYGWPVHSAGVFIEASDSTSLEAVQNLATVLGDGKTIRIQPVIGESGSVNLVALAGPYGADLAIVTVDALGAAGEKAPEWVGMLNYVTKLYTEELHVLAPASVQTVGELTGKRVTFVGAAATTGVAVLSALGVQVDASFADIGQAIRQLKTGETTAFVYLDGKQKSLSLPFSTMDGVHFLPIPFTPDLMSTYAPAELTAVEYPGLIAADTRVETVAVGTVMVVPALQPESPRYRAVANFIDAFLAGLSRLQEADEKWRDVNLASHLKGWERFPTVETWLRADPDEPPLAAENSINEAERDELFQHFMIWRDHISNLAD